MLLSSAVGALMAAPSPPMDLAGEWRCALDREDSGVTEAWFRRDLPDRIKLPGVLQAQGYGDEISTNTPWVLSLYDRNWFLRSDYLPYTRPGQVKVPFLCQPPRHYLGPAWYQRDVEIPANWAGRRVVLFLERARWETRAWLDDRPLGTNNSLCAPHSFEAGIVGQAIAPGRHRLTVRCDNRMILPYRPDAHAVSDSLGSTWNGIIGAIELRSTAPVWIKDVRAFSDLAQRTVLVRGILGNATGRSGTNLVKLMLVGTNPASASPPLASEGIGVRWDSTGGVFEARLKLSPAAKLWDEFNPALCRLTVWLHEMDTRDYRIGLREFKAVGQDFTVNGRVTHLRGTHHGGDFPLTGYPPCDVDYWRKLFATCKTWGLNHVRFHSFCPPEAAFAAADELGFYLQIEPGMWNELSPGTRLEAMLYTETERILQAYGHHPSFVLMSASNEPKGRWKESLPRWVEHFRKADPRHLYTTGTGWSLIDEPGPVSGADYLAVHRIGRWMLRGDRAWFGRDYAASLRGVNVPVVSHELGQWCAYPDYDVIREFTGFLRPGNFEIFRDSLAAHGLADRDRDFARASGRFQLACYKEEIEANLRTPGLSGFQLLDLHDYMGQGTALVGVLDPFWHEKGYVQAGEWRRFCNPVVPLARLERRVFTTAEKLEVPVLVANFGERALSNTVVVWQVRSEDGRFHQDGQFSPVNLPFGRTNLGVIRLDLASAPAPVACRLWVKVIESSGGPGDSAQVWANSWPIWVYPSQIDAAVPGQVLFTHSWAEAEAKLAAGGRVVFQPPLANFDFSSPPLDRLPVFWNRLMGPGWSRMLGLWCDPRHPALAGFPTEANCDWQWTEIIRTRAINLDTLPRELRPVVSTIDDWNRNWKLGLVFECKVGPGSLLVTSFDLDGGSPVARQLRRSLLDYAAGQKFQPVVSVAAPALRALWFDNFVMRKLGATATADGRDAGAVIDGDPNTFWTAGVPARGANPERRVRELTVAFAAPVAFNGVVLLNRQNDRDHLGDIRGYALAISDDGQAWREIASGELASTWNPQTLRFPSTVTAKHLKLTARSGFGADPSVALAEFAILYAGPPLPDNASGPASFRRERSTSADIDEGSDAPAAGQKKSGRP